MGGMSKFEEDSSEYIREDLYALLGSLTFPLAFLKVQ